MRRESPERRKSGIPSPSPSPSRVRKIPREPSKGETKSNVPRRTGSSQSPGDRTAASVKRKPQYNKSALRLMRWCHGRLAHSDLSRRLHIWKSACHRDTVGALETALNALASVEFAVHGATRTAAVHRLRQALLHAGKEQIVQSLRVWCMGSVLSRHQSTTQALTATKKQAALCQVKQVLKSILKRGVANAVIAWRIATLSCTVDSWSAARGTKHIAFSRVALLRLDLTHAHNSMMSAMLHSWRREASVARVWSDQDCVMRHILEEHAIARQQLLTQYEAAQEEAWHALAMAEQLRRAVRAMHHTSIMPQSTV